MYARTYIRTYVQVWSGFVLCSALCVVCTRGWFCSLVPWPEPVVVLVRVAMEGRWRWKNCPRLLISLRAHTYVCMCVHTYVCENVKCVRECEMHPHKLKCILMLPCLRTQCIFQSSPPHSCCVHACHLIFCIVLSMYICMYTDHQDTDWVCLLTVWHRLAWGCFLRALHNQSLLLMIGTSNYSMLLQWRKPAVWMAEVVVVRLLHCPILYMQCTLGTFMYCVTTQTV